MPAAARAFTSRDARTLDDTSLPVQEQVAEATPLRSLRSLFLLQEEPNSSNAFARYGLLHPLTPSFLTWERFPLASRLHAASAPFSPRAPTFSATFF